ncbi:alanine/glycine:cation symporter family protein [Spartinivicinus poritis]|uniref:Alanine/glycine:cation symporter family protein n=1 Tax=Spartinivicinus poritis TaxID=2994640 RepID=A0ABT5U624_9GAMM|nr:alanine/glycine:cation symporter family protein [Spartinivicinus sp. A2-2]MDE1461814.1 alanine/glycine:cation symporter family protein [Spartinivicinus sp. A2-2]
MSTTETVTSLEALEQALSSFVDAGNGLIWGNLLIWLLLAAGIYFTVFSGFIQIRRFGYSAKALFSSRQSSDGNISSFQAFCTSLAARVGTGNLAGVATAIYAGGPGAIFWMWVIALLGMATSFIECTLAQVYKTDSGDGTFRGGPAYYIQKGLGQRWLGIAFAISLIIAFGLVFNAVQSNTISAAMQTAFNAGDIKFVDYYIGFAIIIVAAIVIFGGIRSIARFAEYCVPFMALLYLLIALVVIFMNIDKLPGVFSTIFDHAFKLESAAGGAAGWMIKEAFMNGLKRGLFSNEAGMGSAPNAAAVASPNPPHPATQGIVSMMGVFIDTIVICTATAAIVLLSNQLVPGSELSGSNLTQQALTEHVGTWGSYFIAFAILLFAFTSIVANYYYGETNLMFIKESKALLFAYRIVVLGMILFGAVAKVSLVWNMADLSMGVMAIINIVAILLLSKIAFTVLKDFDEQLRANKKPVFDRKKFPFLDRTMDPNVWNKKD